MDSGRCLIKKEHYSFELKISSDKLIYHKKAI